MDQSPIIPSPQMKKLIECPVCMDLPLPPIYVCKTGHLICNSCQAKMNECPLCKEPYTTARSFVAEGLVEGMILKCRHRDQGCSLRMLGSDLVNHIQVCDFRPIRCIDCAGAWVPYGDYVKHLLSQHSINGVNIPEGYVSYNVDTSRPLKPENRYVWPPYHFTCFGGKVFLVRLQGTQNVVCAWVCLIGPKSMCSNYEAEIRLHPQTAEKAFQVTWKGQVNHFRDNSTREICEEGRGLILPYKTLRHISSETGQFLEWTYHVKITEKRRSGGGESPSFPSDVEILMKSGPVTKNLTQRQNSNNLETQQSNKTVNVSGPSSGDSSSSRQNSNFTCDHRQNPQWPQYRSQPQPEPLNESDFSDFDLGVSLNYESEEGEELSEAETLILDGEGQCSRGESRGSVDGEDDGDGQAISIAINFSNH